MIAEAKNAINPEHKWIGTRTASSLKVKRFKKPSEKVQAIEIGNKTPETIMPIVI